MAPSKGSRGATTTRTWFRVHSFTGVITGLLLFVVCWSGTFATLSHELDWLVTPEARSSPTAERLSWGELLASVTAAHPDARIVSLHAPLYTRSSVEVLVNLPHQRGVRVYVDPYSGQVRGAWSRLNIARFFRSFHRSLFFPTSWGTLLVAAFAVTMAISMIAALVFYRRWWQRFFRFKWGSGRVFWSELHKIAGLWSLWFVVVMVVTGIWYGIERIRYDYFDGIIAFAGTTEAAVHVLPQPRSDAGLPAMPLDTLIAKAQEARPDLEIRTVRPRGDSLYLDGQAGHLLVRDRANQLYLDVRNGEVLYDQRATDLPLYWRWSDTADPLHFGDFGGLVSKLVWFVFGVILSALILTGTWLHAHRLAREADGHSRTRWPGTMAACAVSIAVLAASVPFGLHGAREFMGPLIDGERHLPTLAPGVRAVIIGWIGLTLAIVAAWTFALWRPHTILGKAKPTLRRRALADRSVSGE